MADEIVEVERRKNEVNSGLTRLKPPTANDLSRKRKLATNTKGNRRSKYSISTKSEPKTITAKDRVQEFKDVMRLFLLKSRISLCMYPARNTRKIKKNL